MLCIVVCRFMISEIGKPRDKKDKTLLNYICVPPMALALRRNKLFVLSVTCFWKISMKKQSNNRLKMASIYLRTKRTFLFSVG